MNMLVSFAIALLGCCNLHVIGASDLPKRNTWTYTSYGLPRQFSVKHSQETSKDTLWQNLNHAVLMLQKTSLSSRPKLSTFFEKLPQNTNNSILKNPNHAVSTSQKNLVPSRPDQSPLGQKQNSSSAYQVYCIKCVVLQNVLNGKNLDNTLQNGVQTSEYTKGTINPLVSAKVKRSRSQQQRRHKPKAKGVGTNQPYSAIQSSKQWPGVFRRIKPNFMRYPPFNLIVRLSCGCTGTLITSFHILTSAHCVHDGKELKLHATALKVELPESMGFRMHTVRKIYVPSQFMINPSQPSVLARAMYDYAVISLRNAVPGRCDFMPFLAIGNAQLSTVGQINFIGYPKIHYPNMWQSSCTVMSARTLLSDHFILNTCTSMRGMSGSSAIIATPRLGLKIVGIVSNTVSVHTKPDDNMRFGLIMNFTPAKVKDICRQLGIFGNINNIC